MKMTAVQLEQVRDVDMHIVLPRPLYQHLKAFSEREGRSMNYVIITSVYKFLKKKAKEVKKCHKNHA
jgi:hypothetical protein